MGDSFVSSMFVVLFLMGAGILLIPAIIMDFMKKRFYHTKTVLIAAGVIIVMGIVLGFFESTF